MIEVRHNPEMSRFEIHSDGDLAGFAEYHEYRERFVLDHTEIDDRYAGQGLGSRLASGTLDQIREQGGQVVPLCEFMAGWIQRHPDYADLIDTQLWTQIVGQA